MVSRPDVVSPSEMPIIQNCWVVPDLNRAIQGWLALGIGPFFTFEINVPDAVYRGSQVPLHIDVALAQAGPVQIELIQQLNNAPSAYRDSIPDGAGGFHHICRAYGRYDEALAVLKSQDVTIAMSGQLGPTRFCYADTREQLGCMLELVDESPMGAAMQKLVHDGAINWDGSNPIRQVDFAALMNPVI
jgi:hypothetical protein